MPDPCLQRKEDMKMNDKLSTATLAIASAELREDWSIKEQSLQQFREWIRQNPDMENCITDDNFLLRFLRTKKYSLPMAQQMLLKYLNFRKVFKPICHDMDYQDSKVLDLISKGFMFVSPYRDAHDRRVIITIPNKIDPYVHTSVDVTRAVVITLETLLNDEKNQVLGMTYVADASGLTPAYVAMWNVTEFATLMKWGEQSFPIRHKAIYLTNLPITVKYVLDFAKTRLTPKLRDRISLLDSQNDLHKAVDPKVLPKEYGGSLPMSEMIEMWKTELSTKRERLLSLDIMHLLSDKGIIKRKTTVNHNEILGLQGSFRKLEVD